MDIVMRKIDKDKDGKVSLEDFQATVDEEPLLLEAFGKCLPSERSKNTFLSTLKAWIKYSRSIKERVLFKILPELDLTHRENETENKYFKLYFGR